MKVYLAASWSRREEIRVVRDGLYRMGVGVCSRWLDEYPLPIGGREKHLRENALNDVADVKRCDVFVRFTDNLSETFVPSDIATGGRMFEQGLAFALGKPVFIVGGKQHIFDRLPGITHVKDAEHLKRELSPTEIH